MSITGTNANQAALSAAVQRLQQQAQSGQIPPSSAILTLAAMPPDSLRNLLQSSLLGALSAMPLPNESRDTQRNMLGDVRDSSSDQGKSLSGSKQPAALQQAPSTPSSAAAMAGRSREAVCVDHRQPSSRKQLASLSLSRTRSYSKLVTCVLILANVVAIVHVGGGL